MRFACTRACKEVGTASSTATCSVSTSSAAPTRSSSTESTTAPSSSRLTVNRDIAAGDVLLLRADGSTLEAWQRSRLDLVAARHGRPTPTYPAAGFAGVGLRGTTGRLDDFGARTLRRRLRRLRTGRSDQPASAARRRDRVAHLDRSLLERRRAAHRLQGLPRRERRGEVTPHDRRHRADELPGQRAHERLALRVRGLGREPSPTGRSAVERSLGHTDRRSIRPSSPCRSSTASTAPTRTRSRMRGAGRTGSSGSGETGLHVTSNALACSKTTTCTAWRNTPSTVPTSRSGRRVTTLPGNGNAVRLYTRLKDAGTAAFDGYMLRTNELSGTDQVLHRPSRQRRLRQPADGQPRYRRRRRPAPSRRRLDPRGLASQQARPGRGSARSSDSTYPAAGFAGHRPARDDRPPGRLRRPHARRRLRLPSLRALRPTCKRNPATRPCRSPGPLPPRTAACRSPATRSTAV